MHFAACLRCRPTYMGGIDRGEWNLTLRNIERIAVALGISLSEWAKGIWDRGCQSGRC